MGVGEDRNLKSEEDIYSVDTWPAEMVCAKALRQKGADGVKEHEGNGVAGVNGESGKRRGRGGSGWGEMGQACSDVSAVNS